MIGAEGLRSGTEGTEGEGEGGRKRKTASTPEAMWNGSVCVLEGAVASLAFGGCSEEEMPLWQMQPGVVQ